MTFAAHLMLALEALGVLQAGPAASVRLAAGEAHWALQSRCVSVCLCTCVCVFEGA